MYQKFFLVIFSLFLLTLSSFARLLGGRPNPEAAGGCRDHFFPPAGKAGIFSKLIRERADCRK